MKSLVKIILLIILMLLSLLILMIKTPMGVNLTVTLANKLVPGLLIEKAEGTFAEEILIKKLTYQNADKEIQMKDVSFHWNILRLLAKHLVIKNFQVNDVKIKFQTTHLSNHKPTLPIQLDIDRALINNLTLSTNHQIFFKFKQLKLDLRTHKKNNLQAINVHSSWQDLMFYSSQNKIIKSSKASFFLGGDLNHYQIILQSKMIPHTNDETPEQLVALNLRGDGDTHHINFKNIDIHSGISKIHGNILLRWSPAFTWNADMQIIKLNPAIYFSDWPGQINLAIASHGEIINQQISGEVKVKNIAGTLKQLPLTGDINLSADKGSINIARCELKIGEAAVNLAGQIAKYWNLHWDVAINKLDPFYQNLSGSLHTIGNISGPRAKPNINASLNGENLRYGINKIDAIEGKINFYSDSKTPSQIDININHFKNNLLMLAKANLLVKGTLDEHHISLNLQNDKSNLDLDVAGKFNNKIWQGIINRFAINSSDFANWNLLNTPKMRASSKQFLLEKTCIKSTNQGICTQLDWQKNQFFMATLTANHFDLKNFINFFSEDTQENMQKFSGSIDLQADIKKYPAKPIHGQLKINGTVKIQPLGITLTNIQVLAEGNQSGMIRYQGEAYSNRDKLQISGSSDLVKPGTPSSLILRGENVLISDTPEYQIRATPDLKFEYLDKTLTVNGTIAIPKAKISLQDLQQGTVNLSEDVVFVTANPAKSKSPFLLLSNIVLTLGDDVAIDLHGLTGKLKGKLNIQYNPQAITTAEGNLHIVDGKYSAYGQNLDIQTGRLFYTGGPINNPGLSVQATRTVTSTSLAPATLSTGFLQGGFTQPGEIIVGIELTGTLKNYQARLFSQPAIYSDSDILSMLLLGKPTNELSSGNQGKLLLEAASRLNIGGGGVGHITQQLQNVFGLDELGVATESEYVKTKGELVQTPSLVIGKRILSRVYLSYSMGILEPINIFKITFKLTNNWSIQTSSSTYGNGADVFYNFEY